MARDVPGSGAVIEPIFDEVFGVRAVKVINGGSGYDQSDPPRLTVTGCGTPDVEALLYPIIDTVGKIIHVRVLNRGRGYDPLRLQIIPEQETPNVVDSFDINRIWQSFPSQLDVLQNAVTKGAFVLEGTTKTDRLRIVSDNTPKPSQLYLEERQPGGSDVIIDRNFDQTFIYRGGKDVPNPGTREFQNNKAVGILANGGLLHTADWGTAGGALPNLPIDTVKYDYVKNTNQYDAILDNQIYYYQTSKTLEEFKLANGVLSFGLQEVFYWSIKSEFDNIMLTVDNVDETLGSIEVGRFVDDVAGTGRGEIAKVVKNNLGVITRIYLRQVTGDDFENGDLCLGSNGFKFRVSDTPRKFPGGIFYIEFGPDAHEFGDFTPGVFYFAPEGIKVQKNYLIIWVQKEFRNPAGVLINPHWQTNQPSSVHTQGHPMRFSTTPDGNLRDPNGTLYYNSTGSSATISTVNIAVTIGVDSVGGQSTGVYYFDGVEKPANYPLVRGSTYIFDQSDNSNEVYGGANHPLMFSTGPGGEHNGHGHYMNGVTYRLDGSVVSMAAYVSGFNAAVSRTVTWTVPTSAPSTMYYWCHYHTGQGNSFTVTSPPAWAADYEQNFQPIFIMNGDETQRIYYHCPYHQYMSGYDGDEGYMYLYTPTEPEEEEEETNTYYVEDFFGTAAAGTLDYSRHTDGHSKIIGMSFDGYPIYGPWGYNSSGTAAKETSSYRLRTTAELQGARPIVNTAGTETYTVTVANGEFAFNGSSPEFLNLKRGRTYIFNQDDASNSGSNHILISTQTDGWHSNNPVVIGLESVLYSGQGISYQINGSNVTYQQYLSGFNLATTRGITFTVPVDAPSVLYLFSYISSGYGLRLVNDGYILGDLTSDYIYQAGLGTLDEFNGKFAVTPEYPNGTYAYFMTENAMGMPTYPYAIGPKYYSEPIFEGNTVPTPPTIFPSLATGDVVLNPNGSVAYVKMTVKGDNYFGPAKAKILGGQGSGAVGTPVVQTVTGLSLLNQGRSYATPPTLIFEGGGGQGAQGAAEIDTLGKVTSVNIVNPGEFYQEAPFILISGGGGIGAKAKATISQGAITGIEITDPGEGYTSVPNIIFTKLVNLKRKTRARQAFNSSAIFLTGLVKDVTPNDTNIYVDSTEAYPGSGQIIINRETITYTSKTAGRFSGLTRGVNFNYDQRVILDTSQNDGVTGLSNYKFNVGDRVIRRVENANNKVAKVYDWDPSTRELLVTFEVDELAFIDGGRAATEDAIVQFDAGVAASSGSGILPHVVIDSPGNSITTLTDPIGVLADKDFQDIAENAGAGDGIPDLSNANTDYANQISLDGGIHSSLYGIEETQGGTNTTLFQVGDSIKDGDIPFKYATVTSAGGLSDGVSHPAVLNITLDISAGATTNYQTNEVVTGAISGVQATVVTWNNQTGLLQVSDIVPFNTNNVNIGIGGLLYEFSQNSSIIDFIISNPGTNYTGTPTVAIENTGDIQATGTVVMTTAGDQVASITINNGGYGIPQTIDGTYNLHPTVTFTNASGDTTGANAAAQAVLGGENLVGNGGATYRIKSIEYLTTVRS